MDATDHASSTRTPRGGASAHHRGSRARLLDSPDCARWGSRWRLYVCAQRFQDAPRPGAVPTWTREHRTQMAALAGDAPRRKQAVPSGSRTGREIADEQKACGIVTRMPPRLLTTRLPPAPHPSLAERGERPATGRERGRGVPGPCVRSRASTTSGSSGNERARWRERRETESLKKQGG
jgi:hypothetical protein